MVKSVTLEMTSENVRVLEKVPGLTTSEARPKEGGEPAVETAPLMGGRTMEVKARVTTDVGKTLPPASNECPSVGSVLYPQCQTVGPGPDDAFSRIQRSPRTSMCTP
jgi:hypothetical protein